MRVGFQGNGPAAFHRFGLPSCNAAASNGHERATSLSKSSGRLTLELRSIKPATWICSCDSATIPRYPPRTTRISIRSPDQLASACGARHEPAKPYLRPGLVGFHPRARAMPLPRPSAAMTNFASTTHVCSASRTANFCASNHFAVAGCTTRTPTRSASSSNFLSSSTRGVMAPKAGKFISNPCAPLRHAT